MFKMRNDRVGGGQQFAMGLAILVATSSAWSQSQTPPNAAAAEKTALQHVKGQVGNLLDLDAQIAADRLRREAGVPTQAETQRQAQVQREAAQAEQRRDSTPPPPPPAPQVEAIYGVSGNLTAVVSYGGQQYQFQSGRAFAVGQNSGPRLKSITGRCVTVGFTEGTRTACYRHEANLGPGEMPVTYARNGITAPRQDSTVPMPGQFGVIAPPPPFLSK
ncbi:hypothetical protein [Achromobacter sp.]|uniref:hypothetical protein n=1 Tax=Achromobacter sp. TaxID=134375 RepID=UPI00257B1ED8|nr:hypothetical protein [Achromobacter sp.]